MRVNCPTCKRELEWSEQFPYRPFCSERCKLVDLGAWVAGDRAIAGDPELSPDDEAFLPTPDSRTEN